MVDAKSGLGMDAEDQFFPVIDLAPWYDNEEGMERVAREVMDACYSPGFFYVMNHRVPATMVVQVFEMAKSFFALDAHEKSLVHYGRSGQLRGYIPLLGEATGGEHVGDLKEAFDCAPEYPSSDLRRVGHKPAYWNRLYAPNQWPDRPTDFKQTVLQYMTVLSDLGRTLFGVFALGLGLPDDYFDARTNRPIAELRLLHYPPQREQGPNSSVGIGAHCDSECFTILAQDGSSGIQVKSTAGEWLVAPTISDAFLVTIGDMLARWTNDVLTATPHRVVGVRGGARYSLPFFFGPDYDATVACLPTCTGPASPPRYEPVIAGEYLLRRLSGDYGDQPRTL